MRPNNEWCYFTDLFTFKCLHVWGQWWLRLCSETPSSVGQELSMYQKFLPLERDLANMEPAIYSFNCKSGPVVPREYKKVFKPYWIWTAFDFRSMAKLSYHNFVRADLVPRRISDFSEGSSWGLDAQSAGIILARAQKAEWWPSPHFHLHAGMVILSSRVLRIITLSALIKKLRSLLTQVILNLIGSYKK